jgi:hypothetical protein
MGYKMTSFAPSMSPSCRRVLILLIAWQMWTEGMEIMRKEKMEASTLAYFDTSSHSSKATKASMLNHLSHLATLCCI